MFISMLISLSSPPSDTAPLPRRGPPRKYPLLTPWYETRRTPGIFIIGTASHGRDHRRSAGGFIHGFRYTESCFHLTLTNRSPPLSCRQGYLRKQGLVGNARLWRHAVEAGLMEDFLPEPANEEPASTSQSPDTRTPGFTGHSEL
ncbi:UNVERIFIED_CONTAM: hypothetical protein FKN15_025353 [Acipenser sinensis]